MGPLYNLALFSAAYCTCSRALMCSTGAAMKLTVHPAPTPAMACPITGNLVFESSMSLAEMGRSEEAERVLRVWGLNTLS
jgi:hypothetical protein